MFQTKNFGDKNITPDCFKVDAKGTFPASTVVMGVTFSTTSTLLTLSTPQSSLKAGDYVYSTTEDQVRRLMENKGDGSYILDRPFSTDVSGDDLRFIPSTPICRGISVFPSGGATTILNGMDYEITDPPINWFDENGCGPVAYDATGSGLMFVISY